MSTCLACTSTVRRSPPFAVTSHSMFRISPRALSSDSSKRSLLRSLPITLKVSTSSGEYPKITSTFGQTNVKAPASSVMNTASEMLLSVARCSASESRNARYERSRPPLPLPLPLVAIYLQFRSANRNATPASYASALRDASGRVRALPRSDARACGVEHALVVAALHERLRFGRQQAPQRIVLTVHA